MVYYFKSRCGNYTIYMGKDKYENEDLIKYGWDLDVWYVRTVVFMHTRALVVVSLPFSCVLSRAENRQHELSCDYSLIHRITHTNNNQTNNRFHVDDLSSAHVYLRLHPDQTKLDDISDDLLLDCASLVKANSIEGCKKSTVPVVYTKWKNLHKTAAMVDGQVGFHRPAHVRRIPHVAKNTPIVKQLNKTRQERNDDDLAQQQQDRLRAVQRLQKQAYQLQKQQAQAARRQAQAGKRGSIL